MSQTVLDRATVEALAAVAPDTLLTVQVRAGDLAAAYRQSLPGPAFLTPQEASAYIGWSASQWAAWCRKGWIEGAGKEGKSWRMPKEGVRAFLDWKVYGRSDELRERRMRRGRPWRKQ